MSSIDERVVEMKFKDSSFQDGVKRTVESLKDLKDTLKLDGAYAGLEKIGDAVKDIDLDSLKAGAADISPAFAALATIGVTALSKLTSVAMDFGKTLIDNVMEPLFGGGERRALNLENAKQTFRMLDLPEKQALADAMYGVENTAYGLDSAASAAAQLAASQVKLGVDMQKSLRGISGVAALTNSSYEDIASVFTKVAGQGRLMGDDLNRLGSRGMNAASTLAQAFGVTESEIRDMVSKGQISFQEFANAMDDAYGERAASAADTYTGALGQMRTALARIGAEIAAPKLEALRRIYNALKPAIDAVGFAINPVLKMFGEFQTMKADNLVSMFDEIMKSMGTKDDPASALTALNQAFQNISDSILNIVRPIREAWQEVFPPSLGATIAKFSFWFRDFTEALKITGGGANVIKVIFKGLFSTLKVGLTIVGGAVSVLFNGLSWLFKLLGAVGGLFAPLVKWVVDFASGLKLSGDGLGKTTSAIDAFFGALKWAQDTIFGPVVQFFKDLSTGLDAFLNDGQSAEAAFKAIYDPVLSFAKDVKQAFEDAGNVVYEKFGVVGAKLADIWNGLKVAVKAVADFFKPLVDAMKPFFGRIKDGFVNMFNGGDFNTILAALNTGVLIVFVKKIMDTLGGIKEAFAGVSGFKESFLGALDGLTGVLESMQNSIKADILIKIAIAIGILAAALFVLTSVDPESMVTAAAGLATVAGMLMLAMDKMSDLMSTKDLAKMPLVTGALSLLSTALLLTAHAVKTMASLSWEELVRGLAGFVVILGALVGASHLLNGQSDGMIKSAIALTAMAIPMYIMIGAVKLLSTLSWEELAKGLAGFVVILGAMVLAVNTMKPREVAAASVALIVLSGAIASMVAVIVTLSLLSWENLSKGLLGFSLILSLLVIATNALGKETKSMLAAAVAITAMAHAILTLTMAIVALGLIPTNVLAQGLIGIAIAMTMLVVSAKILSKNVGGMTKAAAGLIAMAIAIDLLVSAIAIMGLLPLPVLIQGFIGVITLMMGMVVAATIMSKNAGGMAKAALGMIAMGIALNFMATALLIISGIGLGSMLTSLLGMAGLMLILVVAANSLKQAAPGTIALIALAAALIVMAVALTMLAAIPMDLLFLSLLAIALVLTMLGVAGAVLAPLAPGILIIVGILLLFSVTILIVAAAVLIFSIALAGIATGIIALTGALVIFSESADQIAASVPAMLAIAGGLLLFGIGAAAAGLGILILGAGITLLAIGLGLIALTGVIGAVALTFVAQSIAELIQYAMPLLALGAVFIVLGAGLIMVGIGGILAGAALIVIAVGVMLLSVALLMLAPALVMISMALAIFLPHVQQFVEHVPAMLLLGVGLAAFGVGAGVAAIGILLLGVALLLLAGGLALMSAVGVAGAETAAEVLVIFADLWDKAAYITATAAALLLLGPALLLVGAGLTLMALGGMIAVLALTTFIAAAPLFGVAVDTVSQAVLRLVEVASKMGDTVAKLTQLSVALVVMGTASTMSVLSITALGLGFMLLATSATLAAMSVMNTAQSIKTNAQVMSASMRTIPPVAKTMSTQTIAAFMTMSDGIVKAGAKISSSAVSLGTVIMTTIRTAVSIAKGYAALGGQEVGTVVVQGMARGLYNGNSYVSRAAREVAANALAAAKDELDSHSPSRKFIALGEDSDEGLALGFLGNVGRVIKAATSVAEVAVDAVRETISDIANQVVIDPSMQPVITPILDLSEVNKGVSGLDSIFGDQRLNLSDTYREASEISAARPEDNNAQRDGDVTNINFTQNNNSPKALSESEIYRQTNNQVSRLKKKGVGV